MRKRDSLGSESRDFLGDRFSRENRREVVFVDLRFGGGTVIGGEIKEQC